MEPKKELNGINFEMIEKMRKDFEKVMSDFQNAYIKLQQLGIQLKDMRIQSFSNKRLMWLESYELN